MSKVQGLDKKLQQKIFQQLKVCSDWRNQNILAIDSPYTSIAHCDLWTNNIMFTCGKQKNLQTIAKVQCYLYHRLLHFCSLFISDALGRVNQVKFCDYQLYAYDSFAHDLIFFLFSSVNNDVRRQHIEHFFRYYHQHLIATLTLLGCPIDDYTYDK